MSKKKFNIRKLKNIFPYIATGIITLALVFVGSLDKHNSNQNVSLDIFSKSNIDISVDQLSELYTVANLSDSMGLASSPDVASNYVIATSMYDSGQTSSGKLEKPNLTNIDASRGILEYEVKEGENIDTIAAKYAASADQIRWSNGLKTTEVSAGTILKIPRTVAGIIYTVKSGDTIDSIASKYGSNASEIIALNDLEVSGVSEGMNIIIKDGSLPETERPEYVAPQPVYTPTYTNYAYSSLGSSSERQNVTVINGYLYDPAYAYPNPNPGVAGWCTWFAWYWRATSPLSLGALGHEGRNARTWHINYAYRGVGNTPVVGAVFQSPYGGGGFGHVGVVVGVNADGSIVVQEMNYAGRYVVTQATIPASAVGNFNYIY